jgi:hypothetical protein
MTPEEAYYYALQYSPSEETRKIACKNSEYAYKYARDIGQCPRGDTRKAASVCLFWAYLYAKDIDIGFHENTWAAVKNTYYEKNYKEFINSIMKEEII